MIAGLHHSCAWRGVADRGLKKQTRYFWIVLTPVVDWSKHKPAFTRTRLQREVVLPGTCVWPVNMCQQGGIGALIGPRITNVTGSRALHGKTGACNCRCCLRLRMRSAGSRRCSETNRISRLSLDPMTTRLWSSISCLSTKTCSTTMFTRQPRFTRRHAMRPPSSVALAMPSVVTSSWH